jgi:hypothetical protein
LKRVEKSTSCRLAVGDTAGWQPALRSKCHDALFCDSFFDSFAV